MRDIYSDFGVAASIVPAVQTATIKGTAVDTKGFGSAMLVINTGAIVGDGLYSVKLQESDTTTDGDFADVASADVLGELPAALAAATAYKQGYIGSKRYIRALITKASGTSIAAGAVVVLGHPNMAPVA